jgi:hypothetical protein
MSGVVYFLENRDEKWQQSFVADGSKRIGAWKRMAGNRRAEFILKINSFNIFEGI